MTREDLKDYRSNKKWIEEQIEWIIEQKSTINKLNSIISDIPGSNGHNIYDKEAEQIAKLADSFDELLTDITKEKEQQKLIIKQLKKVNQPYRNILFKVYIQGKSLVTVASEMNYSYVHICREHGNALNKFDQLKE